MIGSVRPFELKGMEAGQPVEVTRTDCPDMGTHYRRLKWLLYFEGADSEGLYVATVHPPAYDDVQYLRFDHSASGEIRRLARV